MTMFMPTKSEPRESRDPRNRRRLLMIMCISVLPMCPLDADVVKLHDGRRYEGKIVSRDHEMVRIDTKIGRTRVTVGFQLPEVASIVEKELPPRFYDPPPAAPRASKRKFRSDETPYLEVPVVGELGKQVFADGLAAALSYARRHRIRHVVFSIDSVGGDFDEAKAVYELMKRNRKSLTYHGVIRNCLGGAIGVALWCDTLNLLPEGKLGGLGLKLSEASREFEKLEAEEEEIVRAQIANDLIEETGKSGKAAEIVRAMLLPSETLSAWHDKDGKVTLGASPPQGMPRDRIIFQVPVGEPLQLSARQAVALGMPPFAGGAQELGKRLSLPGWTLESDYGRTIMETTAERKQKQAKARQFAHDRKVEKNLSRRESSERYIEHNMKEAAGWDPTKSSYETYSHRWNWGWGWTHTQETNQLTKESQKKWRTRTDACMHYLTRVAKGLKTVKRLDVEAVKLGLEPTYKAGEIDLLLKDIQVRFAALSAHRNKKTE